MSQSHKESLRTRFHEFLEEHALLADLFLVSYAFGLPVAVFGMLIITGELIGEYWALRSMAFLLIGIWMWNLRENVWRSEE